MNTVVKINDVGQVAIDEANLVEQAIGNAVDHAIKCGAALIAKKAELDHGQYIPWLESNMPIARMQCSRYMLLAENIDIVNGSRKSHLETLSIIQHVKLISDSKKPAKEAEEEGNTVVQELNAVQTACLDLLEGREPTVALVNVARAKTIYLQSPALARQVVDGEITGRDAVEQAKALRAGTPTDEDIGVLADRIKAVVPPHFLVTVSDRMTKWIKEDYTEVVGLLEALNGALSKRAMVAFIKLLKYQERVYANDIKRSLPDEIKSEREKLKERTAQLDEREREIMQRSQKIGQVLSDDEVKLIKNCLHPDRAPEGMTKKYDTAFSVFGKCL